MLQTRDTENNRTKVPRVAQVPYRVKTDRNIPEQNCGHYIENFDKKLLFMKKI